MKLLTTDQISTSEIEIGELLTIAKVNSASAIRDIREVIRNMFGGPLYNYEQLIKSSIDEAIYDLGQLAESHGYDGVLGIKIGCDSNELKEKGSLW